MTDSTPNEPTTDPQLDLSSAAQSVDVGDASMMLEEVHTTASKRRRRRNVLGGLAAAGTLAISGAVIATVAGGDDGGDLIVSAPATEPEVADEAPAEEAPEPVAPTTTALPVVDATAPPSEAVAVVPNSAGGQVVSDPAFDEQFGNVRLLEWNGGFLVVRQSFEPQALPGELPDEISEKFSQEVIDFFADGLPPTIDEAIAQLQEAGLYEEVEAVVLADSTVFDAIYSIPSSQNTDFRFSPDGIEWEDIDVQLPDPDVQVWNMMSTGSRLAVLVDPVGSTPIGTDGTSQAPMQVLSTTDLVNWTSQEISRPPQPVDLPEFANFQVYADPIVGNNQFWTVTVNSFTDVDHLSLIDPELRREIETSNRGYGLSTDDLGITIEIILEDGTDESLRFTWEELGVESSDLINGEGQRFTYTGEWGGGPATQTLDETNEYHGQVVTITDGIARSDRDGQVSISTDGLTWQQFDGPISGYTEALIPYGDSLVAAGTDGQDRAMYVLDRAAGTWSPLTIEGLPESFSMSSRGNGVVTLYEFDEGFENGGRSTQSSSVQVAEVDGFRFELTVDFNETAAAGTYTLTNIETGEVVVTETAEALYEEDSFEFAREADDVNGTEDGLRLLDPQTGDELVAIPFSAMDYTTLDADGNEIVFDPLDEPMQPSEWLLATDGTNWVVDQISEGGSFDDEQGPVGFGDAVVANGVVLVAMYDGTFVRYEFG